MNVVEFDDDDSVLSSRLRSAAYVRIGFRLPPYRCPRWIPSVVATIAIALLTACSSSSGTPVQPSISQTTRSSSSSAPLSATSSLASSVTASSAETTTPSTTATQAAVRAFTHYIAATYSAQQAPRQPGQAYEPAADFPNYSFDPIRTQENAYISSLATSGEAFRGTPPRPRVTVVRSDPAARPYPTVILTNCPTPAPTWAAYDTNTGKPVAYTKSKVPPPYLATVTVILYQGHWGVQKISVDTGRTCTA